MRLVANIAVPFVAVCATAGIGAIGAIGAASANAQVYVSAATSCHHITGDGVRIRTSPGGTVLGLTWRGAPVDVLGSHRGQWEQVRFLVPSAPGVTVAWVSDRYVSACQQ